MSDLHTIPCVRANNSEIRAGDREFIEVAVAKAHRASIEKADIHAVWEAIGKRFQANRQLHDKRYYANVLAQSLKPINQSTTQLQASEQELIAWKGRCFYWPGNKTKKYICIEQNEIFEHYFLEVGTVRRRQISLSRGKLLADLREGRIQEISLIFYNDIDKEIRP